MKRTKKDMAAKGAVHLILILLVLCCIVPFLMILSVSLTSETGIHANGYSLWPSEWSGEAYAYIFRQPEEILSAYGVTIFITVFGTVVGTLIMTMMAYPLSREDYKYRNLLSFFIYFTMLFSGGMVPGYLLVAKYLNLKDTVWALILPLLLNAWNIFLLRMFLRSIPTSLIEAARIEGAGEFKIFFRIIIPLGKVGIVTIALFTALTFWNDWYQSMLYIDKGKISSLQYLLYRMMNRVEVAQNSAGGMPIDTEKLPNENLRMALCVVAAGPMIFVFSFFQKYFARGITVGSVKG